MPVQKKEKGNVLGKQFVVNDLIVYQEGAVVSRTLIDKKVGTVTIFAFDEGQGLSEHTAPFDAMGHVLDGEAEIRISGQPFHLKAGEMIVMPANQPHSLRAITAFKMMLIMIRSEDKVAELVSEKGLKP
jgi:quercetin dioxygenase-like cupin family protein